MDGCGIHAILKLMPKCIGDLFLATDFPFRKPSHLSGLKKKIAIKYIFKYHITI